MVISGAIIEKTVLLWSFTDELETSVIFTRQFEEVVLGIVHEYDPADAAVLAMISVQLVPLSVEYSSLTLVTPELVQVMFWVFPVIHNSPLFGEITVIEGIVIEKTVLLWSFTAAFEASLIFTRQYDEE